MYILEAREIQTPWGRSGPGVLRTSGEVAVTRGESEHSCGRWSGLMGS